MQCKGFGYVLFKDKSLVPEALKLHESEYMKRKIRVLVCGKRFKGRRGNPKDDSESSDKNRDFEGRRGTIINAAAKRVLDKLKNGVVDSTRSAFLVTEATGKKKRGAKKFVLKSSNSGISKRASSEKKLDKRVKKIQKRVVKGMGKAKS